MRTAPLLEEVADSRMMSMDWCLRSRPSWVTVGASGRRRQDWGFICLWRCVRSFCRQWLWRAQHPV